MSSYNVEGRYHPDWNKEQRAAYDGARAMEQKQHQYTTATEEDGTKTAECMCGFDGPLEKVSDHIEYASQTAGIAAAARAGEQQ